MARKKTKSTKKPVKREKPKKYVPTPDEFWSFLEDAVRMAIAYEHAYENEKALRADVPAMRLLTEIASSVQDWRERRKPDVIPLNHSNKARGPLSTAYKQILSSKLSKEPAEERLQAAVGRWYAGEKIRKHFLLTPKQIKSELSLNRGLAGLVADRLGEAHGVSGKSIERYWAMNESETFGVPVKWAPINRALKELRASAISDK